MALVTEKKTTLYLDVDGVEFQTHASAWNSSIKKELTRLIDKNSPCLRPSPASAWIANEILREFTVVPRREPKQEPPDA